MVSREILRSRRLQVVVALLVVGAGLTLLLISVGCPSESQRLRQRIQRLEREKSKAEALATRWRAESKAKDQYLHSVTSLLNEVGDRIDQIQQDQQGVTALTVQSRGDSWRVVKNKEIPQALDHIAEQLIKNQSQINQLEALIGTRNAANQSLGALVERLKKKNEGLEQQLQVLRRSLGVLSKKVKVLETKVGTLETEVGVRDKAIEEKDKALGEKEAQLAEQAQSLESADTEKWARNYVVGTRKELCRLGIVAPCGILAGARVPRLSDDHVNAFERCEKLCKLIDARTLQEISLGKTGSKIEILPSRVFGSYKIEHRNGDAVLVIRSLDEFWKNRYLVVVVGK